MGQWLRAWRNLPFTVAAMAHQLEHLESRIMSAVDDLVARLDVATNRIAAKLQELVDELADGDAAAAEKFAPLVAELEALGSDTENPVPDEPVES